MCHLTWLVLWFSFKNLLRSLFEWWQVCFLSSPDSDFVTLFFSLLSLFFTSFLFSCFLRRFFDRQTQQSFCMNHKTMDEEEKERERKGLDLLWKKYTKTRQSDSHQFPSFISCFYKIHTEIQSRFHSQTRDMHWIYSSLFPGGHRGYTFHSCFLPVNLNTLFPMGVCFSCVKERWTEMKGKEDEPWGSVWWGTLWSPYIYLRERLFLYLNSFSSIHLVLMKQRKERGKYSKKWKKASCLVEKNDDGVQLLLKCMQRNVLSIRVCRSNRLGTS